MNKKRTFNRGFTLIELLAVIIIVGVLLGIGITAVTKFIEKARKEQVASQEKTLVMAAQSYLQENRGLLPKNIGETTNIPISVLKNNKYITTTIKNSKNQSCMENSYVTAHKESATKYSYKAYLYCGNEEPPATVALSKPTVNIEFVDAAGNTYNANDRSILEKVSEAKFVIQFSGGTRDGNKIPIDGYSYSILIKTSGDSNLREVYSSGTLNANRATYIYVDRDNNLSDYIDVSTPTTVAIKATVRNLDGNVSDKVKFIGQEQEQAEVIYHDKTNPVCVAGQTIGEASANQWINMNSSDKERKITVVCNDGSGSGCVRSTFTKTWSGNVEYERDVVSIRDNAGNITNCEVQVNIDRAYPVINIEAYAKGRADDSITGNNILTGVSSNASASDGVATINAGDYNNLVGGFMARAKYPNGVIYKVVMRDGVGIKDWQWQVNADAIANVTDASYVSVSANGGESKSGSCSNAKECSIYINLYDNGLRKGILTVKDKAGNKSKYIIYANINRQGPGAPEIINSSTNTENGVWTKSSVTLKIKSTSKLSQVTDYYYSYNQDAEDFGTSAQDANSKWVRVDGDVDEDGWFVTNPWTNEMNKTVYLIAMDAIGNYSDISSTDIKIDKTAPTGMKLTGYKKISEDNVTDVTLDPNLEKITSNKWHSGWVVVIPSGATDNGGSGGIYYSLTVTGASENVEDVKQNYRNVNAEGESTVYFKACDKVNNCTEEQSFKVKLDRTGPTIPSVTGLTGNWTKSSITMTVFSLDAGVGIDKYYYSYTNGENANWVEIVANDNGEYKKKWTSDINKDIYIKACDKLNNSSSIYKSSVKIDNTAPTKPVISNPHNNEWTKSSFSLELTSSDGTGSGLYDYQYTYNENATEVGTDADTQWKSSGLVATSPFTTNPFSKERNQRVYWRVCDAIGNCSEKESTKIQIDKTDPTCGTVDANNTETGVSGTINCEDSTSHCENDSYSFGPLTESSSVTIRDNAGNTSTCPITVSVEPCPTFSDWWAFDDLFKKTMNNCSADTTVWDYEFGNCSDEFMPDICGNACANKCTFGIQGCIYVCCVKRRRYEHTCYTYVPSQ